MAEVGKDSSVESHISSVESNPPKTYGKAIRIEGDKEFQKKTLKDLEDLKKTPTGKNLLESLDNSGKQVTIKPVDDPDEGNSVDIGNESFVDSDGNPGNGSNSTIHYNADNSIIGNKEWENRPPAIGLAHELIHADQAAQGTMLEGEVENDKKLDPSNPKKVLMEDISEVEAVGIPPHDKREFTENKIRSEWDPKQPERKWY